MASAYNQRSPKKNNTPALYHTVSISLKSPVLGAVMVANNRNAELRCPFSPPQQVLSERALQQSLCLLIIQFIVVTVQLIWPLNICRGSAYPSCMARKIVVKNHCLFALPLMRCLAGGINATAEHRIGHQFARSDSIAAQRGDGFEALESRKERS